MHEQLKKAVTETEGGEKKLLDFLSRFIFKTSLAAMFDVETAKNDEGLFEAFSLWDSYMALAAGGISVNSFTKAATARDMLASICGVRNNNLSDLIQARWKCFDEAISAGKMKPGDGSKAQLAMLWASVGNTMPIMFWVIYYLMRSEQAMTDVLKEIASVYSDPNHELTLEDLNRLIFIDAVITEALRLSSGSMIMRYVRSPLELTLANGKTYKFRKGDRVGLCPPIFHHASEIFKNPKQFDPYRWVQGESQEERAAAAVGKVPLNKHGVDLVR